MNVKVHRDYTRMITNNSWSYSHRFAITNGYLLNNSGTLGFSYGFSTETAAFQYENLKISALYHKYIVDIFETGRDFANKAMNNNTILDSLNSSFFLKRKSMN